jgi:hypothetical protein
VTPLAPHLTAFLGDRLPRERRASPHTCDAYAYAFQLLLSFVAKRLRTRPSALMLEQLDVPTVLAFLDDLEMNNIAEPGWDHAAKHVVLGKHVLHLSETSQRLEVGTAEGHRLADHDVPAEPLRRHHAGGDAAGELQAVEEGAEPLLTDAGDGVGHEADRGVVEQRRDLGEVVLPHADVRITHHQHLSASDAGEGDELVHLGVQPRLAALKA